MQLALPLPGAHDLLHHAGAARDRQHPLPFPNQKPTRSEALEYYRKVAAHYQLDVRQYETVERVTGADGNFTVHTVDRFGRPLQHRARKLVVATGYYDLPNHLNIPGEDLPKVKHYYHEPHPYFDLDVVVIGGKNSAAIAALDLWRHGARVTLVHRGAELHRHVKYWIKPDIDNRIKNGEITAYFNTTIEQHRTRRRHPEDAVRPEDAPESLRLCADRLPPRLRLHRVARRQAGREELPAAPSATPQTLESNVPGIYLAGVIVAGERTNEIFIENGRFHGALIAKDLAEKLGKGAIATPIAPKHTYAAE